jgi:hypothetical protein
MGTLGLTGRQLKRASSVLPKHTGYNHAGHMVGDKVEFTRVVGIGKL